MRTDSDKAAQLAASTSINRSRQNRAKALGPLKPDYQVCRSRELVLAQELKLRLPEHKLMDIYMSRIDPQALKSIEQDYAAKVAALKPELSEEERLQKIQELTLERDDMIAYKSTVSFTRKDYAAILGLESKRVRSRDLRRYTSSLLQTQLPIVDEKTGKLTLVNVFSEASYDPQTEIVTFTCNYAHKAVRAKFFDVGNSFIYIQYRLKDTLALESLYSFYLYLYLLDGNPNILMIRHRTLRVSLEELRLSILGASKKSYENFKDFHSKILIPAREEINSKTNITFNYTLIYTGPKVTGVEFDCDYALEKPSKDQRQGTESKERLLFSAPEESEMDVSEESEMDRLEKEYEKPQMFSAVLQYAASLRPQLSVGAEEEKCLKEMFDLYGGVFISRALDLLILYKRETSPLWLGWLKGIMVCWQTEGITEEMFKNDECDAYGRVYSSRQAQLPIDDTAFLNRHDQLAQIYADVLNVSVSACE